MRDLRYCPQLFDSPHFPHSGLAVIHFYRHAYLRLLSADMPR